MLDLPISCGHTVTMNVPKRHAIARRSMLAPRSGTMVWNLAEGEELPRLISLRRCREIRENCHIHMSQDPTCRVPFRYVPYCKLL